MRYNRSLHRASSVILMGFMIGVTAIGLFGTSLIGWGSPTCFILLILAGSFMLADIIIPE